MGRCSSLSIQQVAGRRSSASFWMPAVFRKIEEEEIGSKRKGVSGAGLEEEEEANAIWTRALKR